MKKVEQRALVAECRASGMTAKEWCEANCIEYRLYLSWASKINREGSESQPRQWADITILKEETAMSEIRLSCGKWTICVENGFSAALLSDVIKVIDTVC